MAVDRKEVEALMAGMPGDELIAELCRAWLALDAAPEVTASEVVTIMAASVPVPKADGGWLTTCYPLGTVTLQVTGDTAKAIAGQNVRLVATPTTRGPSDG